MRMSMRRFTRLTNGHSKKAENHAHMVSLHFMHYNFCRIHSSLRVTPAMAAGVTARLWSVEDIVDLLDAAEGEPKKRGPYKPRVECGGSITPLRGYPRPALRALPSLRRLWRRVLRDTPVRHYARPMICMTIKGAVHHVTRSCDLSCRTSSAAHSRASGIFPASLKARAFAKAWLSADRSAADSFPDRAPRALRVAAYVLRIDDPTVQVGFGRRLISTVSPSIATSIRASSQRRGLLRVPAGGRELNTWSAQSGIRSRNYLSFGGHFASRARNRPGNAAKFPELCSRRT
jgi:hypothetical protein